MSKNQDSILKIYLHNKYFPFNIRYKSQYKLKKKLDLIKSFLKDTGKFYALFSLPKSLLKQNIYYTRSSCVEKKYILSINI